MGFHANGEGFRKTMVLTFEMLGLTVADVLQYLNMALGCILWLMKFFILTIVDIFTVFGCILWL